MGWPPSFSIAFLGQCGQQKTHGQLTAANEISSVYLYLFVFFLETIQMSEVEPIIYIYILISFFLSFFLSFFVSFSILFLSFSFPFPSKMVKSNQRRKQDKTRSTQKKMPEPEVQQLHNVGPPVARWRVPTSFSFCTCPLYFAWVFLSYLMPSHFIGIFSLGPCILFYFFRCLTPPWQQTRVRKVQ